MMMFSSLRPCARRATGRNTRSTMISAQSSPCPWVTSVRRATSSPVATDTIPTSPFSAGEPKEDDTARYDERLFSRHELESAPGQLRRSDLDYGLLLYRRERTGETERRLVALAGLSTLVEEPSKATSSELCRRLGVASGSGKTALKRPSVRLAKLVHDLNASLRAVPGLQAGRLVRFRKKQRRYVLTGARATVDRVARR